MGRLVSMLFTTFLFSSLASAQTIQSSEYEMIVVFNQPDYLPGDTVFFSYYLADENRSLDQNRRIVEVSLVSSSGSVSSIINSLVDGGVGHNQLFIPELIQNSTYSLQFTFHGPYYGTHGGAAKLNILFGTNVHSDLLTRNQSDSGRSVELIDSPLRLDIALETYRTRDSISMSLIRSNELVEAAFPCVLNVLNLAAFDHQVNLSDRVQHFQIQLKNKPQARIILKGQASSLTTGESLPDATELIFYQQGNRRMYQTFTSENGFFTLEVLDFFGQDRLLVGANIDGLLLKEVEIKWGQEVLTFENHTNNSFSEVVNSGYAVYRTNQKKIDQSYDFFLSEDIFTNNEIKIPPITITADINYDVTKFIVFKDVAELVNTVLGAIHYAMIDEAEAVRIKFMEETLTDQDPLYFIDGVATFDTKKFLSLPPENIQSIRVITDRRKLVKFGALGNYGILIVETSQPSEGEYAINQIITGLSQPIDNSEGLFREGISSNKPTFRASIDWDPNIRFKNGCDDYELSFVASDDTGDYLISIIGFQDGKGLFSSDVTIDVRVE